MQKSLIITILPHISVLFNIIFQKSLLALKQKRTHLDGAFFLYSLLELCNSSSVGLESKLSELEALLTEGDTYEGNAECNAEYEVNGCKNDAAKNSEDEVEKGTLSSENNSLTEGLKYKLSELEVLLAEGDTYEGNAECKTENEVYCSEDEAAEYAPEEIAEFFHCDVLLEKYYF